MFSRKNLIRIFLNTAIGFILIFFWIKIVDIPSILVKLSKINLFSLLPFVVFFVISNLLRSIRLKMLLNQFKIPLFSIILVNYLGQLFSFTIPLRAGEISKGIYLSAQTKAPFSKSLIWILLDRFLDFWMVLILALLLLLVVPTNLPENLKLTIIFLIGPSTLMAVVIIFSPKFAKQILNLLSYLLIVSILKKLFTQLLDFIIDTVALLKRDFMGMSLLLIFTLAALISDALGWYVFFAAVMGNPTNFLSVFLGSLLSALTYLIPAAPGYVGSAEASGLAVFSYGLGFDSTLTSVATVLNHGLTLFCILFFGLIALYLLKFDVSLLWKKFKKE